MPFLLTPNVSVGRNSEDLVYSLEHIVQPYINEATTGPLNTQTLAAQYVLDVAAIYSIPDAMIQNLNDPIGQTPTQEPVSLRLAEQKAPANTTVVSYSQTALGLPIWETGFSVTLVDPLRVVSSNSTVDLNVEVTPPTKDSRFLRSISVEELSQLLGLEDSSQPIIDSTRLLISKYDPVVERGDRPSTRSLELHVSAVPEHIVAGRYYVVREVLFTLSVQPFGKVPWRTFIEVESGAVVYLQGLFAEAIGYVYTQDPITQANGPLPTAPAASLDVYRTSVALPDITPEFPQSLRGEYASAQISTTVTGPTNLFGVFDYSVSDANFSAVNGYYHTDQLFSMVKNLGFNLSTIFQHTIGTTGFPVPSYTSGETDVNAHTFGNSSGNGVAYFDYGIAASGTTVGIADDPRVCDHEFCHALLFDNIGSPFFGFAHSAGDSLAALINDPGSKAPDRYVTFPWITLVSRRHDRSVSDGWAWGGTMDHHPTNYSSDYNSEQILSTTLFRLYESIGGDSGDLSTQLWASQYVVYLIIGGIASLATSPITQTPTADIFATAMMTADAGILTFDNTPGGEIRKVVRWAFEQQGLYQPITATPPYSTPGAPPPVDVYIDDGRNGEYQYLGDFWETTDIWNRLAADGEATHQTPIVFVTNYAYVRIKNRGTESATGIVVSGYHCRPSAGLTWPDDWNAMSTPSITVASSLSPGDSITVGPFEWVPTEVGHECMLMSVTAIGDISNNDPSSGLPCATGPIPHYQLVPFDNNIAQRNVAPVPGAGGIRGLVGGFSGRHFWVNNPYDKPSRITINVQIPPFLSARNWVFKAGGAGGGIFTLGPRGSRQVPITVQPGADFGSEDVPSDAIIRFQSIINGLIVGGISYSVDPTLSSPAPELPEPTGSTACNNAAQGLLDCFGLPATRVRRVRAKRITIEIDLEEDSGCATGVDGPPHSSTSRC